ncbi:Imm1 family immunity protein [Kitasatospora sp. NPDC056731]|uniref:Imm1 family immunity protein n=1 Tax=Kitasatospora sp. NPDC056731 TaxID=3155422 RepID=UPI00343A58E5
MILTISYGSDLRYPVSRQESDDLITEAIRFISPRTTADGRSVARHEAWFSFTEPQAEYPSANLRVAANETTGFGAVIWFTDGRPPRRGGIYDDAWISDNPTPSRVDSSLVSDPGYPRFHDPASAIPLGQVRAAIEEFCRSGTGARPECIAWVTGDINGQRHDRPQFEEIDVEEDRAPVPVKYDDGSPWAV